MFSGKVAIITGSSRGIGKVCADTLLKRDAKVCISAIHAETLQETLEEFKHKYGADRVISTICDVTVQSQIEDLFRLTKGTFGGIDIVINNAGLLEHTDWERVIDVNLKGVIRCTTLALEYMKKELGGNGGVIINVASIAGIIPFGPASTYVSSKHGAVGFTRSIAERQDVAQNGVRVVGFCPGVVDTRMPEGKAYMQTAKDLLGVLRVEDLGDVFVDLLTDETNNGKCMVITPSVRHYREDLPCLEEYRLPSA